MRTCRADRPLWSALVATMLAVSVMVSGCGPEDGPGNPASSSTGGKGGPPPNPRATPPAAVPGAGEPGGK